MNYRYNRNANVFSNYKEITSKFASVGACGHQIKVGDVIGWNPRHGTRCQDCWTKWRTENAEADAIEAGYMPQCL